ncbi:MAG TPA: GNAT family N-acetyltransferase [Stellaceae bacterium]|nr:GNAT family N-acetyltransferase [Stellaceae bacterium]
MVPTLRRIEPPDVPEAGRICHDAFAAIAQQHNFPPDFPDRDVATGVISQLSANPGVYGVVAEFDGRIAGSNFVDERSPIVGLGPITVDPAAQNRGVGAALMRHMIDRAAERGAPGLRLLQSGYHTRSLCLYTKLGFAVREPIANLQGPPIATTIPGCAVRPAGAADAAACDRLCRAVHGHARGGELRDAIGQGAAAIVERGGRITGYTTQIAFFGHAVGETNEDLKALIAAAPSFAGPGFLMPSRNTELFQWCLDHGLRMIQPMTLMTIGLYNEPRGAWLPSILY